MSRGVLDLSEERSYLSLFAQNLVVARKKFRVESALQSFLPPSAAINHVEFLAFELPIHPTPGYISFSHVGFAKKFCITAGIARLTTVEFLAGRTTPLF